MVNVGGEAYFATGEEVGDHGRGCLPGMEIPVIFALPKEN